MARIELASVARRAPLIARGRQAGNNRIDTTDEPVECRKMPLIPYYLGKKCNGQRIAWMRHILPPSEQRGGLSLKITLRT